jgi:hypothetical protein
MHDTTTIAWTNPTETVKFTVMGLSKVMVGDLRSWDAPGQRPGPMEGDDGDGSENM